MKELVVISGKGGTGKTSLVGAFAALAGSAVLGDCDVDASDLPLILEPQVREQHEFWQGRRARVDGELCTGCRACQSVCRFDAIRASGPANRWASRTCRIDPAACEGCGACLQVCPSQAITLAPAPAGEWFVSDTRFGPMVHARLGAGGENSGKLVSQVRGKARQLAGTAGAQYLLIDGAPGMGCPVIAAIAHCDFALIVTEPTPSGWYDMQRIITLTRHFKIAAMLCVNRWDLNPAQAVTIEKSATENGVSPVGRVRVDGAFDAAQQRRRTFMEIEAGNVQKDLAQVWAKIDTRMQSKQEKHP